LTYFVLFLGLCSVLEGLAVVFNPLPCGVAGLVLASTAGCGLNLGIYFVSLVFMVYLAGMLVGVVYSVPLADDPFLETWGTGMLWGMVRV
ncbi:NU6M oxidoreductase, partial [Urocolius indicus]|nr:NU6M oxidoreductase [Urocolius indicus]